MDELIARVSALGISPSTVSHGALSTHDDQVWHGHHLNVVLNWDSIHRLYNRFMDSMISYLLQMKCVSSPGVIVAKTLFLKVRVSLNVSVLTQHIYAAVPCDMCLIYTYIQIILYMHVG